MCSRLNQTVCWCGSTRVIVRCRLVAIASTHRTPVLIRPSLNYTPASIVLAVRGQFWFPISYSLLFLVRTI